MDFLAAVGYVLGPELRTGGPTYRHVFGVQKGSILGPSVVIT